MQKKIILFVVVVFVGVFAVAFSKRFLPYTSEDSSLKVSYSHKETEFLEQATGQEALEWARSRTKKAKDYLKEQPLYKDIKANLERIFYDQNKLVFGSIRNGYVYNFWTDDKNPQGLWRRTTLLEYAKDLPAWEVLIDVDELSKEMGKKLVFRGYSCLSNDSNKLTIGLSFGGNDEIIFKEWDLQTKQFVENGFNSKNAKGEWIGGKFTDTEWMDDNTILTNPVLDPNDVTESLYPSVLYLWKRGEPIEQAKKIFEIPKDYIMLRFNRLIQRDTHPFLFYVLGSKDFYNSTQCASFSYVLG